MIITSEVLLDFININSIDRDILTKTLNSIGLEVEAEYDISIPKKVVVAKVLKKTQHPNADKLNVCEVDSGNGVLQIVCGAKNVRANQYVALALEGAILPFSKGDSKSTTISQGEIRGVTSYGMLCSSIELGLPKLNDGILELDSSIGELILGKELCEYKFFNQFVLELGITPNRGDCLSVLGIARDIASLFNLAVNNITAIEPSVALGVGRFLQVVPDGCLNSTLMYRLAEVKQPYTPIRIALLLAIAGIYKDDFIDDMLSYATYMSGVIFNAYPMDSKDISCNNTEAKLVIKQDENGLESVYAEVKNENSTALNKLSVIGASSYKTTANNYPKVFILEASFIEPDEIATKLYGKDKALFTDCVTHKSTRGSNPELEVGMNVLCASLNQINANLYSGTQDIGRVREPIFIHITFGYICSCIGNEISKEEIALILKRLNFRIQATCDENFFIAQPPSFRHDIKNRQDIVEEVLRFYGVDKIKPKNYPILATLQKTQAYITHLNIKELRKKALANGYLECLHYVFDDKARLLELGFETLKDEKEILNPITSELNTLRPSLLPHLLESITKNKQFGYEAMRLFEIGYVYDSDRNARQKLAFMANDYSISPSYPYPKGVAMDFYAFAREISRVIGNFECSNVSSSFIKNKLIHPYQSGNIMQNGAVLGIISKLHPSIAKQYKLDSVFFAEIDVALLLANNNGEKLAKEFSKYQANKRDITILLDRNISFNAVRMEIEHIVDSERVDIIKQFYPIDVFMESDAKQALSIRFIFQSLTETLNEVQMQETLEKILKGLEIKFGASLKV